MSKKKCTAEEVADILNESSELEDFSPSDSSYEPSSDCGNSTAYEATSCDDESNASDSESDDDNAADDINRKGDDEEGSCENDSNEALATATWTNITEDIHFEPKFRLPMERDPQVLADLPIGSTEFNVFRKFFPKSLCIFIAQCTNQRLRKLNKQKNSNRSLTDEHEIMVFLGVAMIMHYNHLPSLHDYWSKHPSMGNEMIKKSISRDRFTLLSSKLYLNDCEKPDNAPKDYYIAEVIACMKDKFMRMRSDSPFQSIDECMAKFKGRSSLKQYMPMKPIKRGVKIWLRCDAKTGYTYDLNVYTGKDVTPNLSGTLGERVVLKLADTIRDNDVAIAFDRFFTTITLMKSIPFPAIGTYMKNRKETPEFVSRIERGQSQFQINSDGIIATRWMDSKEVLVVSNCHKPIRGDVDRKQKDGRKKKVACPLAIVDYNRIMGGVDLADQKAAVYDINRKSQKWWKKVFFKILMLATVNAWIVHNDLNRKKSTLIQFIVPLAESMIAEGTKHKVLKTRRTGGRPSKRPRKELLNIGDHLPIKGSSRRRCVRCTSIQKETRTNYVCSGCNNALCFKCFAPYHK